MINEALGFLVAQLNEYVKNKIGEADKVKLGKLTSASGEEIAGNNTLICQLVNVEEERIGKAQLPIAPPQGSNFPIRNPEIKLNISFLLAANSGDETEDYSTTLQLLAYAITFFQYKHYFSMENSPSLPAGIGSLIVELYPLSLENQSYLWGSLGVKYRPSVVYKVRLLTILEDSIADIASAPRNLQNQLAQQNAVQ